MNKLGDWVNTLLRLGYNDFEWAASGDNGEGYLEFEHNDKLLTIDLDSGSIHVSTIDGSDRDVKLLNYENLKVKLSWLYE